MSGALDETEQARQEELDRDTMRRDTEQAILERMDYEDAQQDEDLTCTACGGSGMDSWEGFMPCEECDGEGYRWWE